MEYIKCDLVIASTILVTPIEPQDTLILTAPAVIITFPNAITAGAPTKVEGEAAIADIPAMIIPPPAFNETKHAAYEGMLVRCARPRSLSRPAMDPSLQSVAVLAQKDPWFPHLKG
jgi:hypothetical protein